MEMSRRNIGRLAFWLAAILVVVLALSWSLEEVDQRQPYVYAGLPKAQRLGLGSVVRVLRNPGFLVGYSELRRNPAWVAYRARPVHNKRFMPRPDFRVDTRSLSRVETNAYHNSPYDRGHLAPNFLISNLYGREAQKASFLMSNITPQLPRLNQMLWQRLEEVEADYFAVWFGQLWVLTGPIFDSRREFLASGIEIPDAFFKVYVDEDEQGRPRMLAFIMPQRVRGTEPLDEYVVTVDQVEAQTGFDFFHRLADDLESRLEAQTPDADWRLDEIANLPPRYRVKD